MMVLHTAGRLQGPSMMELVLTSVQQMELEAASMMMRTPVQAGAQRRKSLCTLRGLGHHRFWGSTTWNDIAKIAKLEPKWLRYDACDDHALS